MAKLPLTLAALGENEIVRRLTQDLPSSARCIVGPGDDCAVLRTDDPQRYQLFKTDCVIEHVHFLPTAAPAHIGWKALCRCLSDIAAMGGAPTEAVITVAAPKDTPWARLRGIYQGLTKAATTYGVALVGGETSSMPLGAPLWLSVALLGTVGKKQLALRSGARAGDAVCVTGVLGGSIAGWHLKFTPRLAEAQWLVKHFPPTAMMDLSDGVATDLDRLATASSLGYALQPLLLPCRRGCTTTQALTDGEDYELLFTQPQRKLPALLRAWAQQFPQVPLTCIGSMTAEAAEDHEIGWNHFQ